MEFKEKFLHHIWDQQHLIAELNTVSGKHLKIIYQGQYNNFNGPDFKNTVLSLDGITLRGDTEIHLNTYDWYAHQHHEDISYNSTILHVVYEHKSTSSFTIREDASPIEILELKNQLDADIAKLFCQYSQEPDIAKRSICDLLTINQTEQIVLLIDKYGWERFLRKAQRFNAELSFNSFDQLLYNGFMEAMGYEKNKFNTLAIAQHFGWDVLSEWKKNGMDSTELAAIWINYAGLWQRAEQLLPPVSFQKLRKGFETQNFTTDKGSFSWNLFRIRPANHPVRRIVQAAVVIDSMLQKSFLTALLDCFKENDIIKINKQNDCILRLLNPQEVKLIPQSIGKTLSYSITGNIFLPILNLYAEKTNNTRMLERVKEILRCFPAENCNYIINFMRDYMNPELFKVISRKYILQQGLLQIFHKFCNYRLCEQCTQEHKHKLLTM